MPRADGSPTIAEIIGSNAYYDEDELEMHLENVKFTKSGKDIIASLTKKVSGLNAKGEELKAKIAEVCKARELDPKEVIEAGEDQEKVATYSNKMSNSVGGGSYQNIPKTVIEALQADINNLRVWGSKLARLKAETVECERVINNIAADTSFSVSYEELSYLGF